jgi:hypothetical protein
MVQPMPKLIQVTRAGGGMLGPETDTKIMVDAESIQCCVALGEEDCGNAQIRFKDGSVEYVVETVSEINVLANGN